ncbi:MAG: tripartite tricarboxylate transporter substrate binding protein [Firmicutes bacterium]|jgi:tripartite-type tricarboxylate transporter receptor subunit TctC|nr:tripartite tricarboxylate transporter substrate binding protein [Bacillota bacterium]
MKKFFLIILILLIGLFGVIGCTKGGVPSSSNAGTTNQSASTMSDTKWPEKTVTITVPYNAGGDTDIYARLVAKELEKKFEKPFIVVNMPGGSGVIAAKHVMSQAPDGYNILFNHTASLVQEVTGVADFSYTHDFENAGTVVLDATYTLVCRKDSGWKNLEEMIAYAKANPGKVTYSQVYGSSTHLVSVQMERTMGIELNKIDVGSSAADRTAAFMGKQVDLLVANYGNIKDYIEKGDFIALGICAPERVPSIPDIPTFIEQGYDVTSRKLYEMKFPKGTDKAIVDKLTKALEEITSDPQFKASVEKFHAQAFYRSPEQTSREDLAEIKMIRDLMEDTVK